jgi:hypothetical protein
MRKTLTTALTCLLLAYTPSRAVPTTTFTTNPPITIERTSMQTSVHVDNVYIISPNNSLNTNDNFVIYDSASPDTNPHIEIGESMASSTRNYFSSLIRDCASLEDTLKDNLATPKQSSYNIHLRRKPTETVLSLQNIRIVDLNNDSNVDFVYDITSPGIRYPNIVVWHADNSVKTKYDHKAYPIEEGITLTFDESKLMSPNLKHYFSRLMNECVGLEDTLSSHKLTPY